MNASYEWLKALVPFELGPAQLRDLITSRTVTVDEIVPLRSDLRDVVVGLVVDAEHHPNADHLWVTRVDAGTGELLDVVCGAPNVRAGKRYPFAPAGSTLPGGLKLEKRKIRGAISNGMLCSARELGLSDEHQGILQLDTDAPPGTPFLDAMPVGDTRLVIDVPPIRPDLLSHLGLAREIAAAIGLRATLPALDGSDGVVVPPPRREASRARAGDIELRLEDPDGSPRYMAVAIEGVRVAPSPDWLAQRLTAVGGRPINNIVDITNYLLHELGQPMHAFDADKLGKSAIVVRRAHPGERVTTLDGVERRLEPWMTVIADGERAQAVAGVMGGGDSEVSETTTNVVLEVAHFDPSSVRKTRRALGLSTDASYRFERGTDPQLPPLALERAVRFIVTLAGGSVAGEPVDLYPSPRLRREVDVRPDRASALLGERVTPDEIRRLLEAVGFELRDTHHPGSLHFVVPSWRRDVTREVDLVEEIARLRGYETFPDELRPFRPGRVPDSPDALLSRRVRELLVRRGLLETRAMPFVKGAAEGFVRVANPLSENEAYLRRELLDTLARRAEYNLSHMQRDVRLFEIGAAFAPRAGGGAMPDEELRVAAVIMGHRNPPHWSDSATPDFDEWDAKGLGEAIAKSLAARGSELRPASNGDLWNVIIDGEERGVVRRLALDAPPWAAPAFGVEIVLARMDSTPVAPPGSNAHGTVDAAPHPSEQAHRYRPLPVTPASEFDIALLVPNDMPAARVERVIREGGGELLERVLLFDEYRGEGVPEGFRSLAWRLTFRHPERTLRDKEIAGRREKLLRTLEGELGVKQRTA
ncbi:MAG TPA: phenylalanine--tRNA ligase subunit beta [Gemmatimonadaceae bacterium]|nr:phenylalanine--tRNA ligase subunit beta [Gemmatimonadaceae bacterium]